MRAGWIFAALVLLLALPGAAASQTAAKGLMPDSLGRMGQGVITPPDAPRLVVVLLFDQFRADFLDRFRASFGPGGFRRLEREGARFTECTIPYSQTLTGPGHATVLTGATPRVHGIVGNGWYEASEGRDVGADDDPRVQAVGSDDKKSSSPVRLRAQTVGDVLRGATRGRGKVIGMSSKARAAILSAGHGANAAYWLDEKTGHMQTSTYYMNSLPGWVQSANAARHPERAWATPWTPLLPASAYAACVVASGAPTFPHRISPDGKMDGAQAMTASPYALTSQFEFARQAVTGEDLGADDAPDLLSISVSVPDRVGHLFGPDSPEAMDIAVRADRELADFLDFLDRRVGHGRYVVALSSDHGAATTPSFARRFEAVRADSIGAIADTMLAQWANRTLSRAFGAHAKRRVSGWLRAIGEGNIWLDRDSLAWAGVSVAQAASALADSAASSPWLAGGFSAEELSGNRRERPYEAAVARGYFPGRSGDVVLIARPFAYFGYGPTLRGDHGSPYGYDTHVPLLLSGPGVRFGIYRDPVSTVDIAPTLAALLGIEPPAQCEGRALVEALVSRRPR